MLIAKKKKNVTREMRVAGVAIGERISFKKFSPIAVIEPKEQHSGSYSYLLTFCIVAQV